MAVTARCPQCAARLRAKDELAGRLVSCPACAAQVLLPRVSGPADAGDPKAPVVPATEGASRRTYLFERAYAEYASRLRGFVACIISACRAIWEWFWKGPAASVLEVVLRLAVLVSGILLSILYVRYEQEHGRSFSLAMLPVLLGITVGVGIVMWGWKAPLHLVARAAAGATAVGFVTAVASVAFAGAALVFSAYLLVLFGLTASSFIVFIPLRAAQELWLVYRRIAYHCPNDDCTYTGLPIHVCECGTRYRDLLPSFYGLFHHTCQHGDGAAKLPTLDILGRGRLPRLCGRCERPLIHSSLGELEVKPILVVGGPAAGKTVFIRQALAELREQLGGAPGNVVRIDSEGQDRALTKDLERLRRGQVLAKTAGETVSALGLALRLSSPKKLRCLLHVFDSPGEHFASVQRFGRKQVLQHTAGIVLLVDPFALPALRDYSEQLGRQVSPSSMSFQEVAAVLISGVEQLRALGRSEHCDVPVAVVLSKADALPVSDLPFLAELCPDRGGGADDGRHQRCRDALLKLGEGNALRALEHKFSRVRYFACTALGRSPAAGNDLPFKPAGVLEPFTWLLGLEQPIPVPTFSPDVTPAPV